MSPKASSLLLMNSRPEAARTLRHLPIAGLARVALVLPVVVALDASLRLVGFRRTQRLLGWIVPDRTSRTSPPGPHADAPNNQPPDPRTAAVVQAIDRAGTLYRPGRMCLRRALALWAWLRWQGTPSDIVFGVRRDGHALTAHAWVEVNGRPLQEPAGLVAQHVALGTVGREPQSRARAHRARGPHGSARGGS